MSRMRSDVVPCLLSGIAGCSGSDGFCEAVVVNASGFYVLGKVRPRFCSANL